jgi:hypothetical protein
MARSLENHPRMESIITCLPPLRFALARCPRAARSAVPRDLLRRTDLSRPALRGVCEEPWGSRILRQFPAHATLLRRPIQHRSRAGLSARIRDCLDAFHDIEPPYQQATRTASVKRVAEPPDRPRIGPAGGSPVRAADERDSACPMQTRYLPSGAAPALLTCDVDR